MAWLDWKVLLPVVVTLALSCAGYAWAHITWASAVDQRLSVAEFQIRERATEEALSFAREWLERVEARQARMEEKLNYIMQRLPARP